MRSDLQAGAVGRQEGPSRVLCLGVHSCDWLQQLRDPAVLQVRSAAGGSATWSDVARGEGRLHPQVGCSPWVPRPAGGTRRVAAWRRAGLCSAQAACSQYSKGPPARATFDTFSRLCCIAHLALELDRKTCGLCLCRLWRTSPQMRWC